MINNTVKSINDTDLIRVELTTQELENLSIQLQAIAEHRRLYQKKHNRLERRLRQWRSKPINRGNKDIKPCMTDNQAWFMVNYQYITRAVFMALRDAWQRGYLMV